MSIRRAGPRRQGLSVLPKVFARVGYPRRVADRQGENSVIAWARRWSSRLAVVAVVAVVAVSGPWLWTEFSAYGHEYSAGDAPAADVAIVLGTDVAPDGGPGIRLAGRLQTAAALVRSGRARVILVSGDGGGASGDEPAAMASYLAGLGVAPRQVVADPYGLDTYDSCARARQVYGITRALVVTQYYHLSRAVTLCRRLGIDADGVRAGCAACSAGLLADKAARDYFASGKAAWDVLRSRPPAVDSAASPAVHDALRGG
jgi:vancomycin permeability regulator SanA